MAETSDRRPEFRGADPAAPLRLAVLWTMLAAATVTLIELCLIEHYEDFWQYAPLLLLVLVLAAGGAFAVRATRTRLILLRAVALACLIAGASGLVLHYRGNAEFELEMYPHLEGLELFAETMRGATPVLAPAGMMFIGLMGILAVWRHPAARRP